MFFLTGPDLEKKFSGSVELFKHYSTRGRAQAFNSGLGLSPRLSTLAIKATFWNEFSETWFGSVQAQKKAF